MARIEPNEPTGVRQKQPRQTAERHLDFIKSLPCVLTGQRPVDPAHIRIGCRLLGKRQTGAGEKPHDRWTVPLHRDLHDEQHATGDELAFWRKHGIGNPFALALALYAASCDRDTAGAEVIVLEHRIMAQGFRS